MSKNIIEEEPENDNVLRIEKIKNGTVIDHIDAGKALTVLNILGLDGKDGSLITVGINVFSKTQKKKDIIKIENTYLNAKMLNQIALISPRCTITYIKDYQIIDKFILNMPERFIGIFPCPNDRCISNDEREPVKSEFIVESESPIKLKCAFCGTVLFYDEIAEIAQKK